NKEMNKNIKKYDDFQNSVNDDELIDGAYKIGVFDWEASRILKHSKETRHIFDGHPKSSKPTLIKVIAMLEDCVKYVLSQEYPIQIINIDEYINIMGKDNFERNENIIANALSELPEIYKTELMNRLYTAYINKDCSTILSSNIEFVLPILWEYISKEGKVQISRRADNDIVSGDAEKNKYIMKFFNIVDTKKYLATRTIEYFVEPVINELTSNLDVFDTETKCVKKLSKYAGYIPKRLMFKYVNGITQTFVGYVGTSYRFDRTDFYSDVAASYIPKMFEQFDDESVTEFINAVKSNMKLKNRIKNSDIKMERLRFLGRILQTKITDQFIDKKFIEYLIDESKQKEFFKMIN
ncbi:MAG: hypothetical protein PHH62_06865, partial [Endomicrobiaceae bacterium]|nr:hypothetical protein [Endomicrobiaceae bacterium]